MNINVTLGLPHFPESLNLVSGNTHAGTILVGSLTREQVESYAEALKKKFIEHAENLRITSAGENMEVFSENDMAQANLDRQCISPPMAGDFPDFPLDKSNGEHGFEDGKAVGPHNKAVTDSLENNDPF